MGNIKKNNKISKIPKFRYTYENGRILRIPKENNNNVNMTMTEENRY